MAWGRMHRRRGWFRPRRLLTPFGWGVLGTLAALTALGWTAL